MPGPPQAEVTGHVVLVGMTGSGKSSVAPRVARWLGRPVIDSDALVEAEAAATVSEIFATRGEAEFREMEEGVVVDAVLDPTPAVLAFGGGAVLSDHVRAKLAEGDHCVVWLRAFPETLARNLFGSTDRPLLEGADDLTALEIHLQHMLEERADLYEEVADLVVDVDDRTADEVAAEVIAAVLTPREERERERDAAQNGSQEGTE